jgi:hypothetical protein
MTAQIPAMEQFLAPARFRIETVALVIWVPVQHFVEQDRLVNPFFMMLNEEMLTLPAPRRFRRH